MARIVNRLEKFMDLGLLNYRGAVVLSLTTVVFLSGLALAEAADDLVRKAETAERQTNYLEAERLWQQVLQQHPPTAIAYYHLGLSLHKQLKLTAAIAAYTSATRLDPQYGSAYINLGLAWMQTGEYEQAKTAFQQAIAAPNQTADPADTHTLAHYNLAIIFERQDKKAAALQEVQRSLDQSPQFAPAQQLLEQLQTDQSRLPTLS